ncbi:MAG: hypothetical protein A2X97_08780 [Bdellovibrionales bacterium GWA1_52_35]|nr:MAG: hypothetical protein A2X97_08780 [Bdellovibrionales bacterium GWA1_52_35]HCM38950.1 hypothetical protein [Bdellovibrionales bacterium]
MNNTKQSGKNLNLILWGAAGLLLLVLLFARAVFGEYLWLSIVVAVLLVVVLGFLVQQNRKALRSRTAAYGLNAGITILLVIGIVGVLNFLVARYPQKLDLTKNKIHTLSDQTVKLMRGLNKPVKATFFAKTGQREKTRPLLNNYKSLNPKFEVEFVDPDKEPTRAKQLGVKKYETLNLSVGTRDTKIEDVNEEKLTNALIKLLKDKPPVLCSLTGHGEKSFTSADAEGYETARKALVSQAYEVRDINLVQEQKVPESCDAIAVLGPVKSFFAPEVKILQEYLANGGRAVFALDVNLKGGEYAPELFPVLEAWHVKPVAALIVDPVSRMLGVDASVPILPTFSKEHAITKDFQAQCYFAFSRPLEILQGAPAGMNVQWLAQTTPKSWGVVDLAQLAKGQATFNADKDKAGPLTAAIAVEGKQKDSKATRNTRLVVFGSSQFATNNFSRYGGNIDFFLNAVSWTMEDESLISIRAKEEGASKIQISEKQGRFIFLLTVIALPLLIFASGVVVWVLRRRL